MQTYHVDRSRLPSVVKTDDGYLRGDAVVTRIGVFTYQNADGTIRKELRHPDDVLARDSLETLKMIPITVGHPQELVTVSNADKLSVGSTGENARVDGRHIVVPLTITAKAGIDAVKEGRQELSLGYKLDLIEEAGNYDGESYTHRQRNIRYNHLAIVDQARAGRAARLNLDGIEAAVLQPFEEKTMLKVNVDGIMYDAAPEVVNHLNKQTARADEADAALKAEKSRADKAEAERDEAKGRADKAEKALVGTIAGDELHQRVQARVALESKVARVVNIDDASKLDDRALMVKALEAKHEGLKLDGKSDDYVTARFDAMIDGLGTADDKVARITGANPVATNRSDAQAERDAYQKSLDNLNGWRNQKTA